MKSVSIDKAERRIGGPSEPTADAMLSFIIPVFNEEKHIAGVLDAINRTVTRLPYEIIIVDNESTDRSRQIAESMGATCFRSSETSIGALRNFGAAQARGETLVFIDADVYIQDRWGLAIADVVRGLRLDASIVTGSRCGVSRDPTWIESHWIAPFAAQTECTYMNSGHMIVHRCLFERVGGFDKELETGEDYEFCQKATQAGGTIINNLDLAVVHEGNPRTLGAFFRRERWHGRGDAITLTAIVASKPALLAALQVIALAAALVAAIYFRSTLALLLFPTVAIPIWMASSFRRCRSLGVDFWINAGLYAVYFAARAFAILDVMLRRPSRRRSREFARTQHDNSSR